MIFWGFSFLQFPEKNFSGTMREFAVRIPPPDNSIVKTFLFIACWNRFWTLLREGFFN